LCFATLVKTRWARWAKVGVLRDFLNYDSAVFLNDLGVSIYDLWGRSKYTETLVKAKVDCSGERKSQDFWNIFLYNIMIKTYKISWGTPSRCPTIWDASCNFTSLYHYIIRKCVSKSWTFWYASQSFSWAIYFRCYSKKLQSQNCGNLAQNNKLILPD
jgi:hypothetical protein